MSGTIWRVRMSARAERDLRETLAWSRDRFGAAQASLYREVILGAIRELQEDPECTGVRNRDEILPGLRALHVARHGRRGRHFVLFRTASEPKVIDILRILHDAMDLPRHVR